MAKTKATKPRIAKRKAAVKQARGAKVERRATPRGTTVGKRHAARARRTVAKQTSDLPDLDLIESRAIAFVRSSPGLADQIADKAVEALVDMVCRCLQQHGHPLTPSQAKRVAMVLVS